MKTMTALDFRAAVKRYGPDLQTLFVSVKGDDEPGNLIDALHPYHLSSIEDELHSVFSEIEDIALVALNATGANPEIDGDEDEFVRLDAESAWHLSSFARTLRLKAEELVECADRLESSAYFGWQNKLDADEKVEAVNRRIEAIRQSNSELYGQAVEGV